MSRTYVIRAVHARQSACCLVVVGPLRELKWPMADGGARGRCRAIHSPAVPLARRYVSMRGLI
eukprot:4790458-Prymnesium_polylepis.1